MSVGRRGAADSRYLCCFGKIRIETGATIFSAILILCSVVALVDFKGTVAMYLHYVGPAFHPVMAGYVLVSCVLGVVASGLVLFTRFTVYKMPVLVVPILVCNVGPHICDSGVPSCTGFRRLISSPTPSTSCTWWSWLASRRNIQMASGFIVGSLVIGEVVAEFRAAVRRGLHRLRRSHMRLDAARALPLLQVPCDCWAGCPPCVIIKALKFMGYSISLRIHNFYCSKCRRQTGVCWAKTLAYKPSPR